MLHEFFFFFCNSCSHHMNKCHVGLGEVGFSRTILNVSWKSVIKTCGLKLGLKDSDFELAILKTERVR